MIPDRSRLDSVIRDLLYEEPNFIYRTNYLYIKEYYNFLWSLTDKWQDEPLPITFVDKFTSTKMINPTHIENLFVDTLFESENIKFSLTDYSEIPNEPGVYWLLNEEDKIVYIGKSKNLSNRIIISYLSKLPFGIKSFQYVAFESDSPIDKFEAIGIDFYNPMLNNKKEEIPEMSHREYSKRVFRFEEWFKRKKKISIDLKYYV